MPLSKKLMAVLDIIEDIRALSESPYRRYDGPLKKSFDVRVATKLERAIGAKVSELQTAIHYWREAGGNREE